jgi:hypothetical protein
MINTHLRKATATARRATTIVASSVGLVGLRCAAILTIVVNCASTETVISFAFLLIRWFVIATHLAANANFGIRIVVAA